jgi:tight adherence protein C
VFLLSLAGVGAACATIAYLLLAQSRDRAVVRSSLRELAAYEVESVREQELLSPLKDRALAPVLQGLTGLGRRFTPQGYVDKVKTKFATLGAGSIDALDRFLAMRVLTVALIPVAWFLVVTVLPVTGMMRLMCLGLVSVALLLGPDATLNRKVAERQHELRMMLPEVMDLLVISVEAGLGFEQALDRCVQNVPGALTEEFNRMLGETRAGSTRGDAMRAMEKRTNIPEMRSFVMAVLQADTFGVSIGRILRAQADEMRIKRRQLAQEKAMKAPVKMLVPMVFCIFPAIFVICLGPAMLEIMKSF